MAKVLVTGGTGFIGPRLIAELKERGDEIRCLARRPARLPDGVEAVRGDMLNRASLHAALSGVETVYHLAGGTAVRHPAQYRRLNAQGTQLLAQACAGQATPPRLIYLSSLAAAGPSPPDRPRAEDDPPRPVSRYGQSKLAGERALHAISSRVPVSVVRAPGVFGPGDPNLYKMIRAARMGIMIAPVRADLLLSWIFVDDLVRALILAAGHGQRLLPAGSRGIYFVGLEEATSLGDAAQLAAFLQGRQRVRIFCLPRAVCLFGGHVVDLWSSITGIPRLLTLDKMREGLAGPWTCRVERARKELGHRCEVSLAEGIQRSIAWYKENGWL